MMARDLLGDMHLRHVRLREDVGAGRRVRLHDLALARRQLARLEQDRIRHNELADVMQARREVDQEADVVLEPDLLAENRGEPPHAIAVLAGRVVVQLGCNRLLFQQQDAVARQLAFAELRAQLSLVVRKRSVDRRLSLRGSFQRGHVLTVMHQHLRCLRFLVQGEQFVQVDECDIRLTRDFVACNTRRERISNFGSH